MKKSILQECIKNSIKFNTPIKHDQWDCYKHFTYIVQNNQIIEWGINRAGPPPTFYMKHQKRHSEYVAYAKARGLLNKNKSFDIVNIRLNKQGILKLSKPCICCCAFLKQMGCNHVYFSSGIDDNFARISL